MLTILTSYAHVQSTNNRRTKIGYELLHKRKLGKVLQQGGDEQ